MNQKNELDPHVRVPDGGRTPQGTNQAGALEAGDVTGTEQPPRYSVAERDRRWEVARWVMEQAGVDALVVYGDREGTGPAPFAPDVYFTNDRPGAIVVFARESDPVSLVFSPMAAADHLEATIRGEDVWITPENVRVARHPMGVARVLEEHGLERSRIGVLGLEPYPPFYFNGAIPHPLWSGVLARLPGATFKPVWRSFMPHVLRQSEEERAVIAWSARAGEEMARAMLEAAQPGVPETELYAAAIAAASANGAYSPGLLLTSGPESVSWGPPAWTYRPQAPRRIETGDVVLAEIFCTFGMRETQHQLAIAVGEVHEDFERAARVVRRSYEAGLAALRPGRRFGEVAAAMQEPIDEAGGWNLTPVVHGLFPFGFVAGCGAGLKELPGAERYGELAAIPTIMADVELAPGMVFAFEPDCAFGRRQVNIGGTVIVGENGPIELNTLTNELCRA